MGIYLIRQITTRYCERIQNSFGFNMQYFLQQSFLEEIPVHERKLSVLNKLGQDLATRYHADDSTADLQDVLQDINRRWTVVMERYKPHPLTFDLFRNKRLFPSSVARHQPEVNLLSQQWAEFHSHYQSFHQWLRNMDTDMANLNPFVSNMATVQMQLMKLKVHYVCVRACACVCACVCVYVCMYVCVCVCMYECM